MAQTFKEQINRTNLRQVLNIEAMKTGLAAINKKGTTYKFYEQAMLADPKTSANDLAISFYKLAKGHGMGRYLKKYITKT
jgi:translation initiation factor 6 (eIF-6)